MIIDFEDEPEKTAKTNAGTDLPSAKNSHIGVI